MMGLNYAGIARRAKFSERKRQARLLRRRQHAGGPVLQRAARAMLLSIACVLGVVALSCTSQLAHAQVTPQANPVPRAAHQYQPTLKREAQRIWGLDAPVATFAAQIHQESRWNAAARSPVGALGLTQFMPATARWIGSTDAALASPAPLNPTWAIRALVQYDHWLHQRTRGINACEHMAFVLASYNAGLGTVNKKQRALACGPAACATWFGGVELSPAGQSPANHRETRGYAQNILLKFEPIYQQAGWGAGVCHAG